MLMEPAAGLNVQADGASQLTQRLPSELCALFCCMLTCTAQQFVHGRCAEDLPMSQCAADVDSQSAADVDSHSAANNANTVDARTQVVP